MFWRSQHHPQISRTLDRLFHQNTVFSQKYQMTYEGGSRSLWPDIQKLHQMENAARDI